MNKKFLFHFFLITLAILNGCAKKLELTEPESPIDFQFITVKQGDTFELLAKKHTGSENLAWRIKEFNKLNYVTVGQQLIIPLKPFRPGGLTASGYQLIPVLSYHNFSKGRSKNKLEVSAKTFKQQLQYLQDNNFHVITMAELDEFLSFGQVPEKSVLITIDDGWKTAYDIAYPILKEFGYSATLFIPTQFIDSGHRLAMTWDRLKQIVSDNTIDIQCHTKSHRDLGAFEKNESFDQYIRAIEHDILYSTEKLQNKLGKQVSALAYPFGKTNPIVMALVEKHGYKTAFTVNRKSNPFFKQRFLLNRSMIYGDHDLSAFAKNLNYFEYDTITDHEPVDSLQSLSSIALTNPRVYENKKQWRTALLAWKLRRDKLISQLGSLDSSVQKDKTELVSLQQLITESKKRINELDKELNIKGKQFYDQAIQRNSARNSPKRLLLQSLLLNPEDRAPITLFQNNMGKSGLTSYQVKKNDSLRSIAKSVYKDPKKAILISVFNENIINNNSLVPGMNLSLPAIPVGMKIKSGVATKCNIALSKPAEKLANDYFSKATEYFNHNQISKAINQLKTSICLDSKNMQAREMLEMLEDL